jgi:hypothetical protein
MIEKHFLFHFSHLFVSRQLWCCIGSNQQQPTPPLAASSSSIRPGGNSGKSSLRHKALTCVVVSSASAKADH